MSTGAIAERGNVADNRNTATFGPQLQLQSPARKEVTLSPKNGCISGPWLTGVIHEMKACVWAKSLYTSSRYWIEHCV
jgi:hypothetical protein